MKRYSMFLNVGIASMLLFSTLAWNPSVVSAPLGILYVIPGASGDCSSWASACDLQTALAAAAGGDEIWAAAGTYTPGGERTTTFLLVNGAAVYGGFPEGGGDWQERNWQVYPTVLSGDIGTPGEPGDNVYHVVSSSGTDGTTLLDGFTITGGNADGMNGDDSYGGGIYNSPGSPTLSHLLLTHNSARIMGGGMYDSGGGASLLEVTFSSNTAGNGGGGLYTQSSPGLDKVNFYHNSAGANGGGMYTFAGIPTLISTTFYSNTAVSLGGGVYSYSSNPTLDGVTFEDNWAGAHGGGMHSIFGFPTLTNVTFTGNAAVLTGGGLRAFQSQPNLTNITFNGNTASNGGGLLAYDHSQVTVTNSILWGNTPNQVITDTSTVIATFSIIEGGWVGAGNLADDPLLGPLTDNGGFTRTQALAQGSPAIDTGSPTVCPPTDQRGVIRPFDGDGDGAAVCDMGAVEFDLVITLFLPVVFNRH